MPEVHDQPDGSPNGGRLWSIAIPRGNSAMGVGVCAAFTGMMVFGLVASRGAAPMILTVVMWFFLFAGLSGIYSFAKRILWPPTVLAAVNHGLVFFIETITTTSTRLVWWCHGQK